MKPIQYSFFKNNKQLKTDAKEDLQHSWKDAILATTVAKIIPLVLIFITTLFLVVSLFYFTWYKNLGAKYWKDTLSFGQKLFIGLQWTANARVGLLMFLILLIGVYLPLKYGMERYFLLSAKNETKVEFNEIFTGFKKYLKILGLEFQRQWPNLIAFTSLYIVFRFFNLERLNFLSITLLIIFAGFFLIGLYRNYKTKMVVRTYIENPELDNDDIFEKAKKLMSKRILSYIWLRLSFLPLDLLSILTLGVLDFKFQAYKESATAFYYLDLL